MVERDDCLSYITFVRKSSRIRHKSCFAIIGVGLERLICGGEALKGLDSVKWVRRRRGMRNRVVSVGG